MVTETSIDIEFEDLTNDVQLAVQKIKATSPKKFHQKLKDDKGVPDKANKKIV